MKFNTELINCTLEIGYIGTEEEIELQKGLDSIGCSVNKLVRTFREFSLAVREATIRIIDNILFGV